MIGSMSADTYRLIHVLGVLALFLGLGGVFAGGGKDGPKAPALFTALREGLPPLGLAPLVPWSEATPMLTTVRYPAGVDDRAFRGHLRQVHRIEVGAGLGPLAGAVFRVGLMGHGARPENVLRALAAFGDALQAQGHAADVSAALAAARAEFPSPP